MGWGRREGQLSLTFQHEETQLIHFWLLLSSQPSYMGFFLPSQTNSGSALSLAWDGRSGQPFPTSHPSPCLLVNTPAAPSSTPSSLQTFDYAVVLC